MEKTQRKRKYSDKQASLIFHISGHFGRSHILLALLIESFLKHLPFNIMVINYLSDSLLILEHVELKIIWSKHKEKENIPTYRRV
jgi:hypothetical protein